jgi:hypothetical protein
MTDAYRRIKQPMKVKLTAEELVLDNESRIVCLPCRDDTIRGYANVSLIVLDEAARVPDDLYKTVRPMLAVSEGRLICLSTPYGKRGFFYEAWAKGGDDWTRIEVRAGELVPHEWNYRVHPPGQRAALTALYQEVGFARSLLAYELPDGRLKLIDGHLRRDLDPDMEVDVEVLDVTEEEARTLLLSIDPLASLAHTREQLRDRLREIAPPVPEDLCRAWHEAAQQAFERVKDDRPGITSYPEQFLILVTCRDEQQQVELLGTLQQQGLTCKAVVG